MFEAVLTLSATVNLDDNGLVYFQLYEDHNLRQDFLSPLASIYYQDVYRLLQRGDTLTVTLQVGEVKQSIITNFREGPRDYVFEEAGFAPCPDLFPRIEEVYRNMLDLLHNSTRVSAAFRIQRM